MRKQTIFRQEGGMIQECSAKEFVDKHAGDQRVLLIDVRGPVEYSRMHALHAVNIPLETLSPRVIGALARKAKLFFICKGGSRSRKACELAGQEDATSITGGTEAWLKGGLPVEGCDNQITLERQVRIAAGSLVLLGVVTSILLHPLLLAISAFVGAGLIFAGVTDWCGMALLLAKMPWNKR